MEQVCLDITYDELGTFLAGFMVALVCIQVIWIVRDFVKSRKDK